MTETALPRPDTNQPAVRWFGTSRRLIGGQPDSHYGWLDSPQGPIIIKALDTDLTAYAATLLDHERRMLPRLTLLGAPTPEWVDLGRPDWLATRFAGLSLRRLESPGQRGLSLSWAEQLSAWVHLLRRLQNLADAGVLIIDLHSGNVVLPLTQGLSGQLRLHEVAVIDHAHTLDAGMAMRRPVWLDPNMLHIAPELKSAMAQDQQALRDAFSQVGADVPRMSRLPGERDQHSRRVWAEYDAPQQLQALLDAGQIRPDAAMQYAIGTALQHLLEHAPNREARSTLSTVLARLRATKASDRYPSLSAAAEALRKVEAHLPMVSQAFWGTVGPDDLAPETKSVLPADRDPKPAQNAHDGSFLVDDGPTDVAPKRERPYSEAASATTQRPGGVPMGWIYAAAACGAAAAMWGPAPW